MQNPHEQLLFPDLSKTEYFEDLVSFARPRVEDYIKNKGLFGNAFSWSKFNADCYKAMYAENSYADFKTVKELKGAIPELADCCKQCGSFHRAQRNKSIVIYDVMFGKALEDILIDFWKSRFGILAAHGDTQNKKYPDCMILGKDRGIIAYFEVKYHSSPFISAIQKINRYCYEGSATLDYKKIIKQIEIIDSDIDRPVFYLHWIDYPCLKGIFYETSEQVKDYLYNPDSIFERKEREGDEAKAPQSIYLKKIYSPLLHMGSFDEFVSTIMKMRNNHEKPANP